MVKMMNCSAMCEAAAISQKPLESMGSALNSPVRFGTKPQLRKCFGAFTTYRIDVYI